ncbi:WXG100 family type VII secretion target [Streptomyces sp. NBC_01465]|uniref:WXG100 family type VII secretion target n=1 Tax=Streptomyces sp. NBC_01465 TaxID=2903878 RepID=UPI002E37D78C|nr:hypothetical protein [Streptomyces sp. NBC_01465]
MAYGYTTPQQQEAIRKANEERLQKEHDEKLEEQPNGGMDRPTGLDTNFMEYSIKGLKRMVEDADPGKILEISQHWKSVHHTLSGGEGDKTGRVDGVSAGDSVAGMLDKAVSNVLEHWEGQAAQAFQRKAQEVSTSIRNAAAYASLTAGQMDAVQNDLRQAKETMRSIKEPGFWDKVGDKLSDYDRDDTQMQKDLANGVDAKAAAAANADRLSATKERQLQAVSVMESLGSNYQTYAKNIKTDNIDQQKPITPPNNQVTVPPPVHIPTSNAKVPGKAGTTDKWSSGQVKPVQTAPTVPHDSSLPPAHTLPSTGSHDIGSYTPPSVGTSVDGITTPTPTTGIGSGGIGSGGGGVGGGVGTGGLGGGGVGGGSGSGFGVAGAGGLAGGMAAGAGGRGGGVGGAAGAGRGGAAAGRGMGGMGGGAGAGARGGASGAGGRGALARARGGAVGAAKGVTNKTGAGAGSGLHGSRGGSQRGASGAGGMGGAAGRGKGKKGQGEGSDRPDYLVEDEETWISEEQGRIVPPTIQ